MSEAKAVVSGPAGLHQGNLLNAGVRRDIADLNRLFLTHALDPVHRADCWFRLPDRALQQFEQATPAAIELAAHAPVALFELTLPASAAATSWKTPAVGDAESQLSEQMQGAARRSFGLVSLGVVRRLAEGVPYSSRIAFGLASSCESRLSALSPSEAFQWASWEGLVRPRWQGQSRYWSLLAGAATSNRKEDLDWAYAAGLCMVGRCEREPAVVRPGTSRRARPTHRRAPPAGSDVPC